MHIALVGIGTVFINESVAEISLGLVPPSLWIRKNKLFSFLLKVVNPII